MMGPAGFLLAVLGCGEAEAPCAQLALAPARFESEAACIAAQDEALSRFIGGDDYPVVVAQCRPAAQRTATLTADEVRLPEPRGRIPVRTASAQR